MIASEPLLSVRELSVAFRHGARETLAVDRISFAIGRGETLALVGESGSGKSVTALSILKLLPYPAARHPSGAIRFKGEELLGLPEAKIRHVRGNAITIIFQGPMTSLNPLHTIEKQIGEVLLLQLADQLQYLRLDRDVERSRRLVRNQQLGRAGERHRDHHALAHPAGQLMRIVVDAAFGVGNPDHPQRLDGAVASFGARGLLMESNRLADLAADSENRVERGHRLLKDHRDSRAANVAHLGLAEFQQILIFENNFAADDFRRIREQPHD